MSLEQYLAELADLERPLEDAELLQLSDLTPGEVQLFRQTWGHIEVARRQEVVERLVERAGSNFGLDFSAVFKTCLRDPDEAVRERAVAGLWECEDRALMPPLIDLLRHDPSPRVQASAAIALGRFASLAEEGKILVRDGWRIRETLLEALNNPEAPVEVRCRALEGIAFFNSSEVAALIQSFYDSSLAPLRYSAVCAMGRHGDLQWLRTILQELSSEDQAMRSEAANACGELGEEAAIPHLVRLLRDDDLQIQLSAIRALGNIGGRPAKRALQECLRSGDEALQETAREALQRVESLEDTLAPPFDL